MVTLIKRYKNRKLYNTVTHEYVSMTELATMAERQTPVQVVEHHTGQDVTELTLKRAAFEKAKQVWEQTQPTTKKEAA